MRTLSGNYPKGQEPPRRLRDDLRLVGTIVRMLADYLVRGRRIRRLFHARQHALQKLFVDEAGPWLSS